MRIVGKLLTNRQQRLAVRRVIGGQARTLDRRRSNSLGMDRGTSPGES